MAVHSQASANPASRRLTVFRAMEPLQRHFRARRMRAFVEGFGVTNSTRILDVGGTPFNWHLIDVAPRVTLLNTYERMPWAMREGMRYLRGTGTDIPCTPGEYDIIYSNSVIEHVGDWDAQQRFAAEIRRLAPSYYVQTPNRYFPVEPHMLGIGTQFLSKATQKRTVRWTTGWGIVNRPTQQAIDARVDEIRLLTRRELCALFPDAGVETESVFGYPKSFVALRVAHHSSS